MSSSIVNSQTNTTSTPENFHTTFETPPKSSEPPMNDSQSVTSPVSVIGTYIRQFLGFGKKTTKRSLSEEAECGSPESLSEWLRQGSDPNEVDAYGYTPLVNACLKLIFWIFVKNVFFFLNFLQISSRGCIKSAKILINNGADVNKHAMHGYSPLHTACQVIWSSFFVIWEERGGLNYAELNIEWSCGVGRVSARQRGRAGGEERRWGHAADARCPVGASRRGGPVVQARLQHARARLRRHWSDRLRDQQAQSLLVGRAHAAWEAEFVELDLGDQWRRRTGQPQHESQWQIGASDAQGAAAESLAHLAHTCSARDTQPVGERFAISVRLAVCLGKIFFIFFFSIQNKNIL